MLLHDDKTDRAPSTTYEPLIPIPEMGLRLRFWSRTPVPGHRFQVSFNHYDKNKKWISGHNNDMAFTGDGTWQPTDRRFVRKSFPQNAARGSQKPPGRNSKPCLRSLRPSPAA